MTTFIKTYPEPPTNAQVPPRFRFSIKDLFDVAHEVTTAGSVVLRSAKPARLDAVAVQRLKAAGGWAVGRTNMSEFAFSGVGCNPHYGTPVNPHPLAQAPHTARIAGGSSSGAAASVGSTDANGRRLADIGLGSDTGGSIRIPAALSGLVGFKSTARLVPTLGALPLSTTLDTVGAITRDVLGAIQAHEILAARKVLIQAKSLEAYRVALITSVFEDDLDETVSRVWQRSLSNLSKLGLQIDQIELPELREISHMNRSGGFSPIESYRWHKDLISKHENEYDPRVAKRILLGRTATESDYATLQRERREWINKVAAKLAHFDAVLSPTVPMVAPSIASIATDDAEFFRVNTLLLRNPSIINLLDGCAISLPCQSSEELPVGLMLWHSAMRDDTLLNLALSVQDSLAKTQPP
jgi:Asp-tRNA(Asn)/Glu-tRNA(Gln) amidotransferase A subunit family amidase